jgi:hypothetical protein
MPKPAKKPKPVDLSEYAEEAIPFDQVVRQLARAKPEQPAARRRPAKTSRKRK